MTAKNASSTLLFAAGLGMLGWLVWRLDAGEVWHLVAQVGWALPFILGQELVAHLFNAYGWRLSFSADEAPRFPIRDLLRLRIVGDAVNYLTPSAQLAGEFARASLLDPAQPLETRLSGVVTAKVSQGLAQAVFALLGVALFLQGRVPRLAPYEGALQTAAALVLGAMLAFIALEKLRGAPEPGDERPAGAEEAGRAAAGMRHSLLALPGRVRRYLAQHPGRFCLSISAYLAGFAWGAFEVYWVCRFIGHGVSVEAALAIESLSCVVDGIFFFVPAKAGTQEAGKTGIFALLGLDPRAGLAFGIVRHVRELAWAAYGLALYSADCRRAKAGAAGGPAPRATEPSGPRRSR